ncbi:MAG: hypothetical protein IJS78_05645 [Clostridia bacterium]|nr:hypothetical protein [Clostridia bacterium]
MNRSSVAVEFEEKVKRAERALLVGAVSRELSKSAEDRRAGFAEKCGSLLRSIDARYRGPDGLKRSLIEEAAKKGEFRRAPAGRRKIALAALIAAAVAVVLTTFAFASRIFTSPDKITMTENFEEAVKNPEKRLTRADAINLAYDRAAEEYGDFIRDFEIKAISEDEYHWDVILAREYKAKDFTVYGPTCAVTVMIDGEINLCVFGGGGEDSDAADLIADISAADISAFIAEQSEARYGDGITGYEITDVQYLRDNGPVLRIGVSHFLKEPADLSPETAARWRLFGIVEKKNDCYDFPLE